MIFGAACISRAIVPDRSGSARRRVNKVLRAARRRGGKVSPRIARRIHNPSPFAQTHTARPACRGRIRDNPAMSRLNALRRRRARSRLLKAASPCSTRRCCKSCPAKGTDRDSRMAFRSVATRWKKGDREAPLHVFLRRPTPRAAHSSTADRTRTGRTRAQRLKATMSHAYRMHVQMEFLI